MNYSVPCEYIKRKVDVRITRQVIEVSTIINGSVPILDCTATPVNIPRHKPTWRWIIKPNIQWNGERFVSWAKQIGPNTEITVKAILSSHKIEQQAYKSCLGLIKLADKYSVTRVEAACQRALTFTPLPSYKSVKAILVTGQDKIAEEPTQPKTDAAATYGFTRGAEYYGRTIK